MSFTKRFFSFLMLLTALITFKSIYAVASGGDYGEHDYNYDYNYYGNSKPCQVYDPYEKINRKVFAFNGFFDMIFLRPLAKGYIKLTNDYTKDRIESFTNNLSEPLSTVNYVFQKNSEGALKSFWRFAINTTFGVGGIFDVASKLDLNSKPQTFGSTLAYYGVGPGPYLVLPIFGGASMRDAADPLVSSLLNPLDYTMHQDFRLTTTGAKILHARAKIMPFTDYVAKNSPDPYIAVREAIFNQREAGLAYPTGYRCPVTNY